MGLAAIGAAGALAMGGATAIGATAAAIGAGTLGALSVGTIFTAVATVGAVVSAVGTVAGISELKTAGMVLGGIGGVGSLASAVGAFGEAATVSSIFGGGETAVAGGGANSAAGAAGSFFDAEAAGVWTNNTTGSLINGGAGAPSMDALDIITSANKIGNFKSVGEMEGPDMGPTTASSTRNTTTAATTIDPKLAPQAKTNEMEGPDTSSAVVKTDVQKPAGITVDGTTGAVKTEEPSFWGTSTGKMLGMGVLQAGGSFLEGAFDEVKPAQAAAYMAQAEANNAQAALDKKQLSNMNEGIPVARRLDVTGRVVGPGLINRPVGAPA